MDTKTCTRCNEIKAPGDFSLHPTSHRPISVCRDCMPQYQRRAGGRTSKHQWAYDDPRRRLAHKAIENAIVRGDLTRQPCERCGDERAQAHHDDYSKPLDVMWLCQSHHKQRHRELRASQQKAA